VLFFRVFVYTEPRSATHKSRPVYPEPRRALPAPLPFTPSSHSSLFFSEVCSLFSVTAISQPFVYQSLRHSFHRDGGSHPSSQELCAIFASCCSPFPVPKSRRPLPLRAPKSRRINTYKSLSKQRTSVSFRMIDLQKTGGWGVLWLTSFLCLPTFRTCEGNGCSEGNLRLRSAFPCFLRVSALDSSFYQSPVTSHRSRVTHLSVPNRTVLCPLPRPIITVLSSSAFRPGERPFAPSWRSL